MKKILLLILGTTSVIASAATPTDACPANKPIFTQKIAEALIDTWGKNLVNYGQAKTGDTDVSAAEFTATGYDEDAVLLPTVNPVTRIDAQEIYDYFTEFLHKDPIMSLPEKPKMTLSRCGYGMVNGYYDFKLYPNTDKSAEVSARYTFSFVYNQAKTVSIAIESDGKMLPAKHYTQPAGWYIMTQHSSLLPAKTDKAKKNHVTLD